MSPASMFAHPRRRRSFPSRVHSFFFRRGRSLELARTRVGCGGVCPRSAEIRRRRAAGNRARGNQRSTAVAGDGTRGPVPGERAGSGRRENRGFSADIYSTPEGVGYARENPDHAHQWKPRCGERPASAPPTAALSPGQTTCRSRRRCFLRTATACRASWKSPCWPTIDSKLTRP